MSEQAKYLSGRVKFCDVRSGQVRGKIVEGIMLVRKIMDFSLFHDLIVLYLIAWRQ